MSFDDDAEFMSIGGGCPIHGDDAMQECRMCGVEFCGRCFPRSTVCPECAEDVDEEDDPDFEDVENLDALIGGDDEEIEKIIEDSEHMKPPKELLEDEMEDDEEQTQVEPEP